MKPTDIQIEQYRKHCAAKRMLELKSDKFNEFVDEWYGEISLNKGVLDSFFKAFKMGDALWIGEMFSEYIQKELDYYIDLDVEHYIRDFADSEAAARSDERYDRKDAA